MKLYQKLICPVLYYPGQSYEPKKKYLEDPVVWYPEDMHEELWEKYKHLNTTFDNVRFEYKYEPYAEKPKFKRLKVPDRCSECASCDAAITGSAYCHMESILPKNNTQTNNVIECFIKDVEKRPDWCPIIKTNKELDAMPIESRTRLNNLIIELSTLFGTAEMWEDYE